MDTLIEAVGIRWSACRREPNPIFVVPGNCDVTGNGLCNGQDGNAVRGVALGVDNPLFGQHCQNADYAAPPCTNCE